MWKWIIGALAVIVVLLIGGGWLMYRKVQQFASQGATTTVAIAASPERVYASLATGDSVSTWMATSERVTVSHPGPFAAGDTVHIEGAEVKGRRSVGYTWRVVRAVSPHLLVMEIHTDSATPVATARIDSFVARNAPTQGGRSVAARSSRMVALRTDTLVARGDSTIITSTIAIPMLDSARTASGSSMVGMTGRFVASVFRIQTERELGRLKARVEGRR